MHTITKSSEFFYEFNEIINRYETIKLEIFISKEPIATAFNIPIENITSVVVEQRYGGVTIDFSDNIDEKLLLYVIRFLRNNNVTILLRPPTGITDPKYKPNGIDVVKSTSVLYDLIVKTYMEKIKSYISSNFMNSNLFEVTLDHPESINILFNDPQNIESMLTLDKGLLSNNISYTRTPNAIKILPSSAKDFLNLVRDYHLKFLSSEKLLASTKLPLMRLR